MSDKKGILITGASGLVGSALCLELVAEGYDVRALSRSGRSDSMGVHYFKWDPEKRQIDPHCLDGVSAIVHLAGEGIAALPWSRRRRQQILDSRVQSIQLIYDLIRTAGEHTVRTVVSASATGYYSDRGDELMTEEKPPAQDFLGSTCVQWEKAVDRGGELGIRTVSLRSGIVLSAKGGALPRMAAPIRLGLGARIGSGKQWVPWICLTDAVRAYIHALKQERMEGAYNMVAPQQVTNEMLTRAIAARLKKPLWLPGIPAALLKGVMGQMSRMLLASTKVSVDKLSETGFEFRYPTIEKALEQTLD